MGRDTKYYSKGKLKEGCSLYDLRPDLVKYFKDIEVTKYIAITSVKNVDLICPDCGSEKMQISNLNSRGFKCNKCSDKISIPEKFGITLFKQLYIEFKTQKTFKWSNKRRYDICFKLNNDELLIEIHGMQHYNYTGRGRSLKEEQENDKLKYELAIKNGIKPENYIVIDCRKSKLEWLKENFIKSLENHLDLSNVDWLKIWEDCQKSIALEVWDAWNSRDLKNDTTKTIGDIFGMEDYTIRKYLKQGVEIGKCEYDAKDELAKNYKRVSKRMKETNGIEVCQYNLDGKFISKYNSISEASVKTGINNNKIHDAVNGRQHTSGGYLWKLYTGDINDIKKYIKPKNKIAKEVVQYSLDGNFIKEFESTHDAMRQTGINFSMIASCARGDSKTCKGFIWKYKNNNI